MDVARWQQVEQVLDIALESGPASWPSILEERCGGDPDLRREVESLLARLETAKQFLDSPPARLAAALVAEAREEAALDRYVGCRIGAYLLLSEIGHGGMGRVFLAERADGAFEQRVAVKLLRPGFDSAEERQRFRRERQILAALQHPNIARLLDGGRTDDGVPYLVMEHVEGQRIDTYRRERALDVRGQVALFLAVLEATQYAHRNLVVHRDLKPSNILVTTDGAVKLLDFGLAKLVTEDPASDAGTATLTAQRWMTPEYAAPEQVRGDPATTLTDVYQLGAVLFELLSGRPPFGRRLRGVRDLEAAILESEPPPPSAVANGVGRRVLHGDLDSVVLKALRKEPDSRYASPSDFAEDLQRWLAGHPVRARPQTAAYRVQRFVRRNAAGVATASLITVLLAGYVATVITERNRVQLALEEARLGTRKAEQVTDFMLGLFQASEGGRSLTDTVTARALLGRALVQARELSGQPAMQAQMLDVIGRLHTELGNYAEAQGLLTEALATRRRLHGNRHPDVATSLENLADAVSGAQNTTEAVRLRREALALRRSLSGDNDPRALSALHKLASALHHAGDTSAAGLFDEWLARLRDQPGEVTALRAQQLASAGALLEWRGDGLRAESLYIAALDIRRQVFGDHHHLVALSLMDLAMKYRLERRLAEAEPLVTEAVSILRSAFPDGHLTLARALNEQADLLRSLGRHEHALHTFHEARDYMSRALGSGSTDVANIGLSLAATHTQFGDPIEAERIARESMHSLASALGADNSLVVFASAHVGDALRAQGRYREAEPLLLAAYKRFEVPRPITARWRRYTLGCLVRLYEAQGLVEQVAHYRQLLEEANGATGRSAAAAGPRH